MIVTATHQKPDSPRAQLRWGLLLRFAGALLFLLAAPGRAEPPEHFQPARPAPAAPQAFAMWLGNLEDINLAPITNTQSVSTGQSQCLLLSTCEVEISADNSPNSRLNGPGQDYLSTEYSLGINGDEEEPFTAYDFFLSPPVTVECGGRWRLVQVTLGVRASIPPGGAPNAGQYNATQTLTAHW